MRSSQYGQPWQIKAPKSDHGHRTLPLLVPAQGALRAERTYAAQLQLAARDWQGHDFVFPSSTGTPLLAWNVERDFALLLKTAGLPPKRLHDLRHSTGTYLIAAGVHPRVVMELLGHSQISGTMHAYGHVLAPTLGELSATLRQSSLRDDDCSGLRCYPGCYPSLTKQQNGRS